MPELPSTCPLPGSPTFSADSLSIEVGYRYLVNEEPSLFGFKAGNFDAHVLQVGVGWKG